MFLILDFKYTTSADWDTECIGILQLSWYYSKRCKLLHISFIPNVPCVSLSKYIINYIHEVLPDKMIFAQLVMKFCRFYGNRKFVTLYTRSRQWNLFRSGWIQSVPSHPIFLRSSHLGYLNYGGTFRPSSLHM